MSDSPRPKRPSGLTTPDPDTLRRLLDVEQAILSRTSEKDIDPTLDTVREVMDLLGDPQRSYPVIHLTGTNGKTSTTRMIDSLLTALGLTTGRFTSPHLHSFRERITIGGEPIDRSGWSRSTTRCNRWCSSSTTAPWRPAASP